MLKQVIVVREDLGMSPGKTAAQCAHASLGAYRKAKKKDILAWSITGEKKVVLLCSGLDELKSLLAKAKSLGIAHSLIEDAGMTELPPGTITCLGLGPAPEDLINKVTGSLRLLK